MTVTFSTMWRKHRSPRLKEDEAILVELQLELRLVG